MALKETSCGAEGKAIIYFPLFSPRLKVEELEAERSRLEEENRSLEMKLEQITLQVRDELEPERTRSWVWSWLDQQA